MSSSFLWARRAYRVVTGWTNGGCYPGRRRAGGMKKGVSKGRDRIGTYAEGYVQTGPFDQFKMLI